MQDALTSQLSEEQLRVFAEAKKLTGKIRVALALALSNAVVLACFGGLSVLLSAVDFEISWVGAGLLLVAYNEYRGRQQLLATDVRGPASLALNQLALLAVVLLYCATQIYGALWGPDPVVQLMAQSEELSGALAALEDQTGGALDDMGGFVRQMTVVLYGAVAAISLVVQGLLAVYYRSLRDPVAKLNACPAWTKALL